MPNKPLTPKAFHMFQALAHGWKPKRPKKKLPSQAEAMEILGYTKMPKRRKRK